MNGGNRRDGPMTQAEVRRVIEQGFRPLLKRPLNAQQSRALAVAEAWNDMARAAQGKRLLQRLSVPASRSGPSRLGARSTTFGGLTPTPPPRIALKPTASPPLGTGALDGPGMERIRRYEPKLPGRKPTALPPSPPKDWRGPRGRTDPFPKQVGSMPMERRQPWLRGYYAANPMAAANARSEARRMIDWAHRRLK